MSDRDEHRCGVERALLAGKRVTNREAFHLGFAVHPSDLGVPCEGDLWVVVRTVGDDLGGTQGIPAVHDRDLRREAGQEGRLFDRGVATADDGDVLVLKEEAVACRAPRHAAARQPALVGKTDLTVRGAHRQDYGASAIRLAVSCHDRLNGAGEVDVRCVVPFDLGAELLGLPLHVFHELRAEDPRGESREVLDIGRVHECTARGDRASENERLKAGPCGIDRGGIARRA